MRQLLGRIHNRHPFYPSDLLQYCGGVPGRCVRRCCPDAKCHGSMASAAKLKYCHISTVPKNAGRRGTRAKTITCPSYPKVIRGLKFEIASLHFNLEFRISNLEFRISNFESRISNQNACPMLKKKAPRLSPGLRSSFHP